MERFKQLQELYRGAVEKRWRSQTLGLWLLERSEDGVCLVGPQGVLLSNKTFSNLCALSRRWSSASCAGTGRAGSLRLALLDAAHGVIASSEELGPVLFHSGDGEGRRTIEARIELLPDGAETQAVILVRDITESERLGVEREAARQRDLFLAMLAHELRNPLSPILAAAELILRDTDDTRLRHAANTIVRQARHESRLVDELLDTARVQSGKITLKKQTVDLRRLVEDAVEATEALRREQQITLDCDVPAAPVWADVDPTRVVQALVNVLANAARFTRPGGGNWVELREGAGIAWIRVRDNGIGIAAEMLPRVFDVFYQAEPAAQSSQDGLGLGLALVRSLTQLHGGGVRAASDGPGTGTEFTLWLPVGRATESSGDGRTPGARSMDTASQYRPTPNGAEKSVLVVDDNSDARETLCELLVDAGYRVSSAANGPEAMSEAENTRPDAVVTDIRMPGMDGYQLAEELRRELPAARLIALSGYGKASEPLSNAFDAYLVKPVDFEALLEELGRVDGSEDEVRSDPECGSDSEEPGAVLRG